MRKRGRKISMCGSLWLAPYWRPDLACNPGMIPDWELNWQPFGFQATAQSIQPHQPGLWLLLRKIASAPKCFFYLAMKFFLCSLGSGNLNGERLKMYPL